MKDKREDEKKLKEERNFEIFNDMPYKFETKAFTMKEKHPVSKLRFENTSLFLANLDETDHNQNSLYKS